MSHTMTSPTTDRRRQYLHSTKTRDQARAAATGRLTSRAALSLRRYSFGAYGYRRRLGLNL
jgi:hypothetical protein